MSETTIEYIGYVAMVFIAFSFLLKDIKKLRLLNLIGAVIFIYYGILLNKAPIYILNTFIAIVNIYFLFKKSDQEK